MAATVPARQPSSDALQAVEVAPRAPEASKRVDIFDSTGSIRVPDSALDELQRNISDERVFDYQVAGLAKARTAFQRLPPLTYDRSRFEDNMRPTTDMLQELLQRAVEASIVEIEIPIPGDPHRRIVCNVVVLAAAGGCGIVGFTGAVDEDDPNTLNDEEEKQSAAWWEQITTTSQQGTWLQTRKLYDMHCRKPREGGPLKTLPMPKAAAAG